MADSYEQVMYILVYSKTIRPLDQLMETASFNYSIVSAGVGNRSLCQTSLVGLLLQSPGIVVDHGGSLWVEF